MKNILCSLLVMFFVVFLSSCGDKKTGDNTSKDTTKTAKTDTIKANATKEDKKDTTNKTVVEKKDTTSTIRQTEKTQVEEP